MSIQPWIKAARLRTLPLAASGVILGSALAMPAADGIIFGGSLCSALLLQILSNYANDYGDYKKGTDKAAGRADRMLTTGEIHPAQMKKALGLLSVLCILVGMGTLTYAIPTENLPAFALIFGAGLLAVWAAIRYTAGRNPYGYYGFGDLAVLLFFGLFAVCGTYYLHTGTLHAMIVIHATGVGLLAAGVLNVNNTRDLLSDTLSGKQTLAVRFGFNGARRYQLALILTGWAALCLPLLAWGAINAIPAAICLLPTLLHLRRFTHIAQAARVDYNRELKFLSLSILALVLITSVWVLFVFSTP
jgi:1,4-dihydroxy-2-naphthoate polyprenyltransferase